MLDLRPVAYVIGLMVAALGMTMLFPAALDYAAGSLHWAIFLEAGLLTTLIGVFVALSCRNAVGSGLSVQQTFILTTSVWIALPLFGAFPFVIGATEARFVDAYFEAMSGLTTTGATVFSDLDDLPLGLNLWRGILQWLGGIGIIVVAMVFLPELRVGGMQIFRSEGFDTMGKILPRATEIAQQVSVIYLVITCAAILAYLAVDVSPFDAVMHALTTVSTGGFSNHDASFSALPAPAEYVAVVFMIAAALPFVRYVQLLAGDSAPLWKDSQIRSFVYVLAAVVILMVIARAVHAGLSEEALRKSLFNVTSILTGTGYASDNYMAWGTFAVMLFFFVGLIGGCAGSTSCSIKVFRYQLLFTAVASEVNRIQSPHGVFTPRYEGRRVSEDVVNSVISFFMLFILTLGVVSILLNLTGLDFITSVSGASAALANIGPGLGDVIGPTGNYATLPDAAKWILIVAMLIGRLELMAVFVLFTSTFWRA
ncbi:MAG: TrkH family potassium uptake protein [Pseudomonadota bacterium]